MKMRKTREAGLSLIEVMVAAVVIALAVAGTSSALALARRHGIETADQRFLREVLEQVSASLSGQVRAGDMEAGQPFEAGEHQVYPADPPDPPDAQLAAFGLTGPRADEVVRSVAQLAYMVTLVGAAGDVVADPDEAVARQVEFSIEGIAGP